MADTWGAMKLMSNGESFMEFDVKLESYNIIAKKVSERCQDNQTIFLAFHLCKSQKCNPELKLECGLLRARQLRLPFLQTEPRRLQGVIIGIINHHYCLLAQNAFTANTAQNMHYKV